MKIKISINALFLILLFAFTGIAFAYKASSTAEEDFDQRIQEIKSSKQPVKFADLVRPNILDKDNGAIDLIKIEKELVEFEKEMFERNLEYLSGVRNAELVKGFDELERKYPQVLPKIGDIAKKPHFAVSLPFASNPRPTNLLKAVQEQTNYFRSIIRLLQAKTNVEIAKGNGETAAQLVIDMVNISRHSENLPFLVSHTVSNVCHKMTLSIVEDVLHNSSISPELRKALDEELSVYEKGDFARTLATERVFGLENLRRSNAKSKIRFLDFFEMEIANSTMTSRQYDAMLAAMDEDARKRLDAGYETAMVAPAIKMLRQSNDHVLAYARCLRILNRIQLKNIQSQNDLASLDLINFALLDPFTDKELVIEKTRNGWSVLSCGRNQAFDNGLGDDIGILATTKQDDENSTSSEIPKWKTPRSTKDLIQQSVERLVELQETDGAWPYEGVYRVNRKIPVGYRIGGTAIVCSSLLHGNKSKATEADDAKTDPVNTAIAKGVKLILAELEDPLMAPSTKNAYDVRVWGHIYALELFCQLQAKGDAEIAGKTRGWIQKLVDILIEEEIDGGGWNYANQRQHACFVTAPALQALLLAKQWGATVPDEIFYRGKTVLKKSRTEKGAFQYSGTLGGRRGPAKLPGSIARSAICESTLILLGEGDANNLQASIDAFHENWEELEKRRKKTGTHKPPYNVAPYYFYYGHRYLAQAINLLPEDKQQAEFDKFQTILMKTKDEDNTWNDRVFDRSKAFGTAMSIISLNSSFPMPPSLKEIVNSK